MTPTPATLATTMIDPIYNQSPAVDPESGLLTQQHWWWLFQLREGAQGAIDSSFIDSVPLTPSGGSVTPDLALSGVLGSFQLTLTTAQFTINNPIFTGKSVPAGAQLTFYLDQPAGGNKPPPKWQVGPGGFSPDLNTLVIIEEQNTRSTYVFGFDGVIWTLKSFATGETL